MKMDTKRIGMTAMIAFLAIAIVAAPVLGQNPHFVQPIQFVDLGTELRAIGQVAGLGNGNIDVLLNADGVATITCRNNGGEYAPGQKASISVSGKAMNVEVKNGKANFVVETVQPPLIIPSDGICANPNWQAIVADVDFTSATITVFQPAGTDIVAVKETFVP